MYLLKCKCGSRFTISEETFNKPGLIKCPNCKSQIFTSNDSIVYEIQDSLSKAEIIITKIPNDAKLTVKFDA